MKARRLILLEDRFRARRETCRRESEFIAKIREYEPNCVLNFKKIIHGTATPATCLWTVDFRGNGGRGERGKSREWCKGKGRNEKWRGSSAGRAVGVLYQLPPMTKSWIRPCSRRRHWHCNHHVHRLPSQCYVYCRVLPENLDGRNNASANCP